MKEFRDGKNTYLAFDYNVGNILKSAYEHNDSDDALIFSKAADILQKDIVDKDNETFDGTLSIDGQKNYLLQCLQLFFDIKKTKNLELSLLMILKLIVYNTVKATQKNSTSVIRTKVGRLPAAIFIQEC